jgi:hypothetical protein
MTPELGRDSFISSGGVRLRDNPRGREVRVMSEFSIQVRAGPRWGAPAGSASSPTALEHPPVPGPGRWGPSLVADEPAAWPGALTSAVEEGLPHQFLVTPSAVLNAWRSVERELGQVPMGSPTRDRLATYVECLRDTYHRLYEARARQPPLR